MTSSCIMQWKKNFLTVIYFENNHEGAYVVKQECGYIWKAFKASFEAGCRITKIVNILHLASYSGDVDSPEQTNLSCDLVR